MYSGTRYTTGRLYEQRTEVESRLEYIAHSTASYHPAQQDSFRPYSLFTPTIPFSYSNDQTENKYHLQQQVLYDLFPTKSEYHFLPEQFLIPGKEGIFVGKAEEIRPHIENAFEKIFGKTLPGNIKISICKPEEFKKIAPTPSVVGLSINRTKHGLLSEVFIPEGSLGRVMLTLGHELGHVLTQPLDDSRDEEAKAYAFSFAWMKVIKENNIANLQDAIVLENPAHNGLHDVAFSRVIKKMEQKSAWEVYREIVGNKTHN
ncbi:MAG: hypothetical protein Q8Q01_00240 [archaeon]|nr:hypothetical protein [archaeon]